MISQKISKLVIIFIAISFIVINEMPAFALPANQDYFGRNTERRPIASVPTNLPNSSAAKFDNAKNWFVAFDNVVEVYKPTASERVILGRPLNQDVGRVKEWTKTAQRVANNYRHIATTIKSMPIPASMSDIKEYRNLTADWYTDAAQIFIDLTTPRAPARTMEELESQMKDIHDRSQNLVQTNTTLQMMDNDIRQKYDVPSALSNDPIRKYAQFKPHED